MSAQNLESIMAQVERLSPQEQLQIIKRITEMLGNADKTKGSQRPVYGRHSGASGSMSTEEDFADRHSSESVATYQSIAAYAARHGGSDVDLDPELESAAIEHWRDMDEENGR